MKIANEKMEDDMLRPMGHMERFNVVRHHLKFYNKVNVTARYTAPRTLLQLDRQDAFKSLIYQTLTEVLQTQPLLSVVIEDESSQNPKWRCLETIDFDDIVSFVYGDPEGSWDECILKGHRKELDRVDELPLWRVVVASTPSSFSHSREKKNFTFTLAFYSHHVIADGLSGAAFHLSFKNGLNTLLTRPSSLSGPCNSIIEVPKMPLVHSLEQGNPLPLTFWFLLKKALKTYIYSPLDPLSWTGPLILSSTPRPPPCNLKSFDLPPHAVTKLVAKCREEKTSITALLAVLTARKLAVLHPEYKTFGGTVPMSLRRFSGHGERDMGVFVTNIEAFFSSSSSASRGHISCYSPASDGNEFQDSKIGQDDELLWQSAREMKEVLRTGSKSATDQNVGLLRVAGDYRGFFLGRLGGRRDYAFEITNIGVVNGGVGESPISPADDEGASANGGGMVCEEQDRECVSFDKVSFSGSTSLYGPPYTVAIASVKAGCMNVCVRWGVDVVSDGEAREFAGWLEGVLKGLCE